MPTTMPAARATVVVKIAMAAATADVIVDVGVAVIAMITVVSANKTRPEPIFHKPKDRRKAKKLMLLVKKGLPPPALVKTASTIALAAVTVKSANPK